MLLFDKITDFFLDASRKYPDNQLVETFFTVRKGSTPIEITNVLGLIDSTFYGGQVVPTPKIPPFKKQWVEYNNCTKTPTDPRIVTRVGFFVIRVNEELFFSVFDKERVLSSSFASGSTELTKRVGLADRFAEICDPVFFVSFGYCMCADGDLGYDPCHSGIVVSQSTRFVLPMCMPLTSRGYSVVSDSAREVGINLMVKETGDGEYIGKLPESPVFYAFSLLNCKNIVLTDKEPQGLLFTRARRKRGYLPFSTYKEIEVVVPARKKMYKDSDHDLNNETVRYHLCRGHFKDLQHDRYKNKGWHWWPDHWRGDIQRGFVVKDYKFVPDSDKVS